MPDKHHTAGGYHHVSSRHTEKAGLCTNRNIRTHLVWRRCGIPISMWRESTGVPRELHSNKVHCRTGT